MPIRTGKRQTTMQDAWWDESGRTKGQSECLETWRAVGVLHGRCPIHPRDSEVGFRSRLGRRDRRLPPGGPKATTTPGRMGGDLSRLRKQCDAYGILRDWRTK